jgi:hypothetical protein
MLIAFVPDAPDLIAVWRLAFRGYLWRVVPNPKEQAFLPPYFAASHRFTATGARVGKFG